MADGENTATQLVPLPRSAPLRISAVVVKGPDAGLRFPLSAREVVVGAGEDCPVHLQDSAVSRRHLALSLRGAAVHLRDLGSTNGTFVGNSRIIESLVPAGTMLRLGRTFLHLQGEEGGAVLAPSAADRFGELYGVSPAMRQLFAALERVAPAEATVLLDGETGTGKELAARALHDASPRARGPFCVFDCSSVVPDLASAQLFGHARGAFTGAIQDRAGLFEAAAGGTLFLDELDSLPAEVQPRLLRALERRAVVRLGESRERPVDARVIAAARRSPEALVEQGILREDLYFRLAVVRLSLPRLRERSEDIPLLCERLLRQSGSAVAVREGAALERLRQYAWPGNVRELRNALQRALALAPEGASSLDDLPLSLAPPRPGEPAGGGVFSHLPYEDARAAVLARWEAAYLGEALERNGGNLSATAREVGLTRHYLRKLLRRRGLVE